MGSHNERASRRSARTMGQQNAGTLRWLMLLVALAFMVACGTAPADSGSQGTAASADTASTACQRSRGEHGCQRGRGEHSRQCLR